MKKAILNIFANKGYSAKQVTGITLGELKNMIEEYIDYLGEDAEVVTQDEGNMYGASFGIITGIDEEETEEDY